jgi:3',5'-cyclic AMP phosphodiesterase CpdA
LNRKEISRIRVPDSENFTFAVFGDNKSNCSFFEPLLKDIDRHKEIAFTIAVGDLVSNGERGQYRAFLNQVRSNLTAPLIGAIGNHDLNLGSSSNFREIFGPTYYGFQAGRGYFIVLDATSEAGFDKDEREWLENELQKAQAYGERFIFMHVPPFDPRGSGYNKCLVEKDRKDLLALFMRYHVTHLFASHLHGYFSGVWEGIPYTITGGGGAGLQGKDPEHFFHHYVRVQVNHGKTDLTVTRIDAASLTGRVHDLVRNDVVEYGLLILAAISLISMMFSIKNKRRLKSGDPDKN